MTESRRGCLQDYPSCESRCFPMQILKVRGARLWNKVKSNRLRPGAMLLLCLFVSCCGNLFYRLTRDLISCLIDGTERGAFVSPWRKRRVNHGFQIEGKCCWRGRSRLIKTETNALHLKSDPAFSTLKCQFNLELLMIRSQAQWQHHLCTIFPLLTRKETG